MVYGYVFGLLTNTKRSVAFVIFGMVFFVPHVLLEGVRFQLIPLYVVLAIFGVGVVSRLLQKNNEIVINQSLWKRVLAGGLGTLLLTATLIATLYFFPILKVLEPTGPYTVGVTNYHWLDKNREETYADPPVDHRELMVRVWYPAEMVKEAKKAHYALDAETTSIVGKKLPLGYRMLLYSWLQAENHSYTDVPIAYEKEQYPVLVFSPGFGFSPYMYSSQMEELASHGYVVFGIDHPYHSEIATVFPEGRIAEGNMNLPEETENIDQEIIVWVEDVLFTIDKINEMNEYDPQGQMTGRLDVSRMGMFGHSFGGATTAQVMHLEPQIIAGVNMDGFFYGSVIEDGLDHPIMLLTGSEEMILHNENGDPVAEADYPQWAIDFVEEERKRKNGALKNNGVKVVLEEADHLSFSDTMLYSPYLDLAKYDPALLAKINQTLLEFFDKHVKEVRP